PGTNNRCFSGVEQPSQSACTHRTLVHDGRQQRLNLVQSLQGLPCLHDASRGPSMLSPGPYSRHARHEKSASTGPNVSRQMRDHVCMRRLAASENAINNVPAMDPLNRKRFLSECVGTVALVVFGT